MKKILSLLLLSFLAIFFYRCNDTKEIIDELLTFKFSLSQSFTFPATMGIELPIQLELPTLQTNISQTLEQQGTSSDKVKSIKLNSFVMVVESPEGATFQPFEEIIFYIKSETEPKIEFASAKNIPQSVGNMLEFVSTNASLDKYILGDSFGLEISAKLRQALNQSMNVKSTMEFQATASPL
jgi:hypothetical protein